MKSDFSKSKLLTKLNVKNMVKKNYFKKSIKPGEVYTAEDFLNEKEVKTLFTSKTNEPPFGIPPMVYVQIIFGYYIPENDSYEIKDCKVVLLKNAQINPETGKVEQTYRKDYVEGHIWGLFNLIRPCDNILSIEINDGRWYEE